MKFAVVARGQRLACAYPKKMAQDPFTHVLGDGRGSQHHRAQALIGRTLDVSVPLMVKSGKGVTPLGIQRYTVLAVYPGDPDHEGRRWDDAAVLSFHAPSPKGELGQIIHITSLESFLISGLDEGQVFPLSTKVGAVASQCLDKNAFDEVIKWLVESRKYQGPGRPRTA